MRRVIKLYTILPENEKESTFYVLAFRWNKKIFLFSLWPFGHFGRAV